MRSAATTALALIFAGSLPLLAQDSPKPLPPARKPSPQQDSDEAQKALQTRISRLVDGLAAESFEVRERSFDQLVAIGPPALPALEAAKQSDDPEVAAAAAEAVAVIRTRHRVAPPRTEARPEERVRPEDHARPREDERQDRPQLPQALPGRDEMLEQLQKQFPEMKQLLERFQDGNSQLRLLDPNDPMFKDLLEGRNPFEQLFGQQDEEEPGTKPKSRVFTWSNVPQQRGPAASLGLRVESASPVLRAQLSIPAGQALAVLQVAPGSFAATQGIQQFDLLLEANGKPILSEQDLLPVVQRGGQVTILRQAKRQVLNFVPAPRAPQSRPRILRPAPQAPKKPAPAPQEGDDQRDF